jgi:hypothetical protein
MWSMRWTYNAPRRRFELGAYDDGVCRRIGRAVAAPDADVSDLPPEVAIEKLEPILARFLDDPAHVAVLLHTFTWTADLVNQLAATGDHAALAALRSPAFQAIIDAWRATSPQGGPLASSADASDAPRPDADRSRME